MSKSKKTARTLNRTALIDLVTKEVWRLARQGDESTIYNFLSALGWIDNFSDRTATQMAAATIALVRLAGNRELQDVAGYAIGTRTGDHSISKARSILEPLGVKYAACGCPATIASDNCCENGTPIAIRNTTITSCTGSAVAL